MGLDMYFSRKDESGDYEQIYYFRKHADLHGFLSKYWIKSNPGKTVDDFNQVHLPITEDILKDLSEECKKNKHKMHKGYFWGVSDDCDWEETRDKLIPTIAYELGTGGSVYYYPWW